MINYAAYEAITQGARRAQATAATYLAMSVKHGPTAVALALDAALDAEGRRLEADAILYGR